MYGVENTVNISKTVEIQIIQYVLLQEVLLHYISFFFKHDLGNLTLVCMINNWSQNAKAC